MPLFSVILITSVECTHLYLYDLSLKLFKFLRRTGCVIFRSLFTCAIAFGLSMWPWPVTITIGQQKHLLALHLGSRSLVKDPGISDEEI